MDGGRKLLASGRDCDIFEHGSGAVLRRSRGGRSQAEEARTMAYVREQGYPVPAVIEISDDGLDLVLERVDGPSMAELIGRRPWTLATQGRLLADLHTRLHRLAAPEWLAAGPGPSGDRLIHLDLHPLNVIAGPGGPVVIDWASAACGDGSTDVALAWLLMGAAALPFGRLKSAVLGSGRALLVRSFLSACDRDAARARLREVVEWKVNDPHMSPAEQDAMWRLVEAAGA